MKWIGSPRVFLRCLAIAASCTLVLSACGGGGSGDSDSDTESGVTDDDPQTPLSSFDESLRYQGRAGLEVCSVQDLNAWVEHDMRDYYIFYDQVPTVRLDDFSDPSDVVAAMRVGPDIFSGVRRTAAQVVEFEEGLANGYGYWMSYNDAGELRFREIRLNSPMYLAGIRRGDQLLAVNGIPVDDLESGELTNIVENGDADPPRFRVESSDGSIDDLTVTPGEYTLFTSPTASYNTLADGTITGYLPVTRFLNRTGGDVDFQLEWLIEQGVERLVLDLRYNGGGRSFQAERVASQLLGSGFDGQVYQNYLFNDKYVADEFVRRFVAPEVEFPVTSIAILTTDLTASASEALINGLKPYVDVTVIGDTTSGKPFASWRVDYCDLSLNAMRATTTNANNVSVTGGITPDCFVEDEWLHESWQRSDALHGAALDYFENGTCNTGVLAKRSDSGRQAREWLADKGFFDVPASE